MLMAVYPYCIDITLVSASTGYIFTIFIVMGGLFSLTSAIVQYIRKIKLLNKLEISITQFCENTLSGNVSQNQFISWL